MIQWKETSFVLLFWVSLFKRNVFCFILSFISRETKSTMDANGLQRYTDTFKSTEPEPTEHLGATVRGYDFSEPTVDYHKLLSSYGTTGFQASAFAAAVDEINRMVSGGRTWRTLLPCMWNQLILLWFHLPWRSNPSGNRSRRTPWWPGPIVQFSWVIRRIWCRVACARRFAFSWSITWQVLVGWLIDWLTIWVLYQKIDPLIHGLIDWLIDWLHGVQWIICFYLCRWIV